jgi:FKBP-type peptidyl-prolyl cis-trans isomerase
LYFTIFATMAAFTPLTSDGGVQKQILQEGSGAQPQQGEMVWAHYTGRLEDGSVFDSSIGKPHRVNGFNFTVGAGQVIEGYVMHRSCCQVCGSSVLLAPAGGTSGLPP